MRKQIHNLILVRFIFIHCKCQFIDHIPIHITNRLNELPKIHKNLTTQIMYILIQISFLIVWYLLTLKQ